MIDIEVLSTAAGLQEFDAATVAAYCHTDEARVVLVLDEHGDLFTKRIARHQAQPTSPRYRVLHPDALARRISSFDRTPDFAPSPLFGTSEPGQSFGGAKSQPFFGEEPGQPFGQGEPERFSDEAEYTRFPDGAEYERFPAGAVPEIPSGGADSEQPPAPRRPVEPQDPLRSRPRPPRSAPRPRRPERGDQPRPNQSRQSQARSNQARSNQARQNQPRFTQGSFTSGGYTSAGASTPRTALGPNTAQGNPNPTVGRPPASPQSSSNKNSPRNPAPWNRPPAQAAQRPSAQQQPANPRSAPARATFPQLGAPSVPNPDSHSYPHQNDLPQVSSGHAGLDRLEVIHTRDPEPDPRIAHAENTLLACAREADPEARHALASAAMSALGECVPSLPRDGELHTAELPPRLRFALTLATLTLIESTGQPIARKLLISAYDDAAALAQEFLPSRQSDLISRFRALASGRSVDYPPA